MSHELMRYNDRQNDQIRDKYREWGEKFVYHAQIKTNPTILIQRLSPPKILNVHSSSLHTKHFYN